MSVRNCPIRRKLGEQDEAFKVEAATVYAEKVSKLKDGRQVQVWITPNWCLALCRRPDSILVGTYNRKVAREDFIADCLYALNGPK